MQIRLKRYVKLMRRRRLSLIWKNCMESSLASKYMKRLTLIRIPGARL